MSDFFVMMYVPENDQIEQLTIRFDKQSDAEDYMNSVRPIHTEMLYVMEVKAAVKGGKLCS